ncbi:MAG: hypothetical protein KDA79_09510 [Planctomycetaceae bacterium]|nr:hypothetical protein [Planctomycetaceae bacterium]
MVSGSLLLAVALLFGSSWTTPAAAQWPTVELNTPLPPPGWAVLERELLRANAAACREYYQHYFDERGYLQCVERWGGDDGPDDAIENCADWPILHALGGADDVLEMYRQAWEGHLEQYTKARTTEVPFAREGMYYREFPVMFDWLHNSEGLRVFALQGLSDHDNPRFQQRTRRYAGLYLNEDPAAPNYDPEHRIIRSLFNGSRGPLLRKATALDWAGDPIQVKGRFQPRHGEETWQQMLDHFAEYNDIVGDHPSNLCATSLAMNAWTLTGEEKYRRWLLEYVDAWLERMEQNDGIIPSNIGLDGTIGGETDGKWYGGVYGWNFVVTNPVNGQLSFRTTVAMGFVGFMNAYVLTGDEKYLEAWRNQSRLINSHSREVNGRTLYPHAYGDDGWHQYTSQKYNANALEIWYLSMNPADREEVGSHGWINWLEGNSPGWPEQALRGEFATIRQRIAGMRADTTTPDTRLADDPMRFNPCTVTVLQHLMHGGISPGRRASILNCRVRYFDPARRRAGIPEDVAALVDRLTAEETELVLVNLNQLESRTVLVQAGGYGEHQFAEVTSTADETAGPVTTRVDGPVVRVRLAPGAGGRLKLATNRYSLQPVLKFPWQR